MSQQLCQGKFSRRHASRLHWCIRSDLRMSACSAWSQAPRQALLVALLVAWGCPAVAGTEDCGMGGQAMCGASTGRYGLELEHLSAGAAAASRSDRDAPQGSHSPTPRTQPPRDALHRALLPAPQRLPQRWCPAAPRPVWGRTCGQVRRLPRHAPFPLPCPRQGVLRLHMVLRGLAIAHE